MKTRSVILVVVAIAAGACETSRPAFLKTSTPHETYAESLREAGLHETALGRDWIAAADRALREPAVAKLPVSATVPVSPAEPRALGYRLTLQRGRVLKVAVTPSTAEAARFFVDLYRAPASAGDAPRHVASAEPDAAELSVEIARDGEYLLRLQPELLRGGTFRVSQETTAALGFPVAGRGAAAVGSRFRDPRDGGRREHHGIDIFAPKETPVVAASGGIVTSVGTNNLGGNVVWLYDPKRGHSQYYAHLSRQAVTTGQVVQAGDVLGYVGNTGNARTTPPHLHFGIYARGDGPVDPLPFVN